MKYDILVTNKTLQGLPQVKLRFPAEVSCKVYPIVTNVPCPVLPVLPVLLMFFFSKRGPVV